MNKASYQAAVIGASLGGVMAAYQLAKRGMNTLLVSEFSWIGGQITSQAVPPDEHPFIESFGASDSYYQFRQAIRGQYLEDENFVDNSELTEGCNPGDGWVSRLCFEPKHAELYLRQLLQPFVDNGCLTILEKSTAVGATRQGRKILDVTVQSQGITQQIEALYFIDGTDTGQLLKLADMPYRLGKESQALWGERLAPSQENNHDQQPVTYVMALRYGKALPCNVIEKPAQYDFWQQYILPHYNYPIFGDTIPGEGQFAGVKFPFFGSGTDLDLWRYRRIVAKHNWKQGLDEVSLINWAQNDFALQPLLDGEQLQEREVVAAAKQQSLCFLYWLQTCAERSCIGESGQGFTELSLATDMLGTTDGFAQQIYVRESRRIIGLNTLTQTDIECRSQGDLKPATCTDSVGIGLYNMDIHPTCASLTGSNAKVRPFELPLGVFIGEHVDNLIPACKNISVSHLVNAATRVHPIEWLIGEVAGLLASFCMQQKMLPTSVYYNTALVQDLQQLLTEQGIPLHWPDSISQNL